MFTISFVKPPFTSINMLLLFYGTLRVSFHSSQKCCAKWSQCQRMYFILLYLLALLGCFLCEQLSCSFVSQWKWCHTLVSATGCSHCLSLRPWVTSIFICYFTPVLGLVWSLREAVHWKLHIFLLYFFMGHLRVSCPQRSHLCKCFHKGNNPWVHQATEGKGKRAWLRDIKSLFP